MLCCLRACLRLLPDDAFLEEYDRRLDAVKAHDVKKRYKIGKKLGAGVTSEVFEAVERASDAQYAMKKIPLRGSASLERAVNREVTILKKLRHHHIVYLHDVCSSPAHVWVFLEYVSGGELSQYVLNQRKWSEEDAGRCVWQILSGLTYLHSQGVIHRDIKLANLLRSSPGKGFHMKIADFGAATTLHLSEQVEFTTPHGLLVFKETVPLKDTIGTPCNMAPEVFNRAYGAMADMWSFGCVVYELLAGEPPFDPYKLPLDDPEMHLKRNVRAARYPTDTQAWKQLSHEGRSMVQGLLTAAPHKRLSAWEALAHPWLQKRSRDSSISSVDSLDAAQQARKTRKASLLASNGTPTAAKPLAGAAVRAADTGIAPASEPQLQEGSGRPLPMSLQAMREPSAVFDIADEHTERPPRYTGVAAYYDNQFTEDGGYEENYVAGADKDGAAAARV